LLTLAYIVFAVLGCAYILVSFLLGHLFDGGDGGGHDGGGVHVGGSDGHAATDYGVSSDGHGSVHAHGDGPAAFHFPLFSPLAISVMIGSIGGYGLISKHGFGAGDTMSLLAALPAALATTYGVTYASWRLMRGATATSFVRLRDLVGAEGEVTTQIPENGPGEVSVIVLGNQNYRASARSTDGRLITRGAPVRVDRVSGSTLFVTRSDTQGKG
jgi:membrane protein implicated in regulation of membrane protease activity